ncbi:hypothetical protein F5Y12DRAFT_715597 [Xylaria sp. FL1777]|nr:hypothetical protein F5Y12DRAFT_715597 [Xylaria sp. FL1777]
MRIGEDSLAVLTGVGWRGGVERRPTQRTGGVISWCRCIAGACRRAESQSSRGEDSDDDKTGREQGSAAVAGCSATMRGPSMGWTWKNGGRGLGDWGIGGLAEAEAKRGANDANDAVAENKHDKAWMAGVFAVADMEQVGSAAGPGAARTTLAGRGYTGVMTNDVNNMEVCLKTDWLRPGLMGSYRRSSCQAATSLFSWQMP